MNKQTLIFFTRLFNRVLLYFTFALGMLFTFFLSVKSQINIPLHLSLIDYAEPKEYTIGGITISGIQYLDRYALTTLSGLAVGDKIEVPGEKITKAIETLWKQGLFCDIKITATKIQGDKIFLDIYLEEKPRLSYFTFKGINKTDADNIREKIKLVKEAIVTDDLIIRSTNLIKNYFIDKGFLDVQVNIIQQKDTTFGNKVALIIQVEKNKKIKINEINFYGNKNISSAKLRRTLKETKERFVFRPFADFNSLIIIIPKNLILSPDALFTALSQHYKNKINFQIFKPSLFIEDVYKDDKYKIIEKYNEKGFRDAKIVKDSIYRKNQYIDIDFIIDEGHKYYFRNITWVGNTKYDSKHLSQVLGIKKGDIYNQKELETRLYMNPNGADVSSLYLDDGYLFFSVTPVEIAVEDDSIDLEMRIYEGKQARINKVTITGNTKTNDQVIMREIRTKPGQLFSRSDIIRSQRELAYLGYFDPEKLNVNPIPNPQEGTVDIEYIVEEKPSDQLQLSGGWGAGRIVGTIGVGFTNFSIKNTFKKHAWRPIPSGDGQKLSIYAQSNGLWFQSYNISFTEPWLGGKKPNTFTVSLYNSIQTNGKRRSDPERTYIDIKGISFGLGKRLKKPDDFFTLFHELSYQSYKIHNFYTYIFTSGYSNNISYGVTFGRNSLDQLIYPRYGANISLKVESTPPYSVFSNKDYSTLEPQEKYRWTEYHKWKVQASWFTKIYQNFVLNTRINYGFLGYFNKNLGITPFERFYLGGDGLTGYALDEREIIALRGYENLSLTPVNEHGNQIGGTIYTKYTLELRYPFSLNPNATIYALIFAEAGNAWLKFSEFKPFNVKRSLGFGIRINLPMFGMLGLDWGYGFDESDYEYGAGRGHFHFTIGPQY